MIDQYQSRDFAILNQSEGALAGMLYNRPVTLRSIALLSANLAPARDLRLCPTPESPEEKKEAEAAIEADAEGG